LTPYIITGAACIIAGFLVRILVEHLSGGLARTKTRQIIAEAKQKAETIEKEIRLAGKEELFKLKEGMERENEEVRRELRRLEKRLSKREDNLDAKVEIINKKERYLDSLQEKIAAQKKEVEQKNIRLDDIIEKEKETLLKITGLSQEEAKELYLKRLEGELQRESSATINKFIEDTKEQCDTKAREIISLAIQRCAANHTIENVVSSIDIPSDEMKGRIIGREGRNIRAFEKATGVDVIVDDTPGVIVISGFDSVRREVARRAMEKLIFDGRIHPSRIEEVVEDTREEVEQIITETGKQTMYEVDVHGLHPKEIMLLGRLRFRTSYGQNVLQHSKEVAYLSGIIAGELNVDVQMAKRCGLLHDIGKAVDHEMEGGHPEIGADLAKRFNEPPAIVNAIAAHH